MTFKPVRKLALTGVLFLSVVLASVSGTAVLAQEPGDEEQQGLPQTETTQMNDDNDGFPWGLLGLLGLGGLAGLRRREEPHRESGGARVVER